MKLSRDEVSRWFGPVWTGAGANGWWGEGYWFHHLVPGCDFSGATLVAKTITAHPNKGNMELTSDYRPVRPFPACIHVDVPGAVMLNAVGLSGPGIMAFLRTGRWQKQLKPFMISVMPVKERLEEQLLELEYIVRCLRQAMHGFRSHVGIQLNISCPNVGADLSAIVEKAGLFLDILGTLDLPLIVKLNLLVSPEAAHEIAQHPHCSGICTTNSLPFGTMPEYIDWKELFPLGSPLGKHDFPPGGLSGAPLLPLTAHWIRRFRRLNKTAHVNAGGGILHKRDLRELYYVGTDSVFLSSVGVLRPWRVKGLVREARANFRGGC